MSASQGITTTSISNRHRRIHTHMHARTHTHKHTHTQESHQGSSPAHLVDVFVVIAVLFPGRHLGEARLHVASGVHRALALPDGEVDVVHTRARGLGGLADHLASYHLVKDKGSGKRYRCRSQGGFADHLASNHLVKDKDSG